MGAFSEWQPQYAACGIATFPVRITAEEKRPRVTGWNSDGAGLEWSSQLILQFADASAFGFTCGPASRLTVIDYDSDDDAVVQDGERMFGASPFMVRTGRGYHAYFRHGDERRDTSELKSATGLPIDICGAGGYVVAAPSVGVTRPYEVIRGGLADLERLPYARLPDFLGSKARPPRAPRSGDPNRRPRAAGDSIPDGERHEALKKTCMRHVWHVDAFDGLVDCARTFNELKCIPPVEDAEVVDIARWYWDMKEKGLLVRVGKRHWMEDAHELIKADRDAGTLFFHLRMVHPSAEQRFVVANAMAKSFGMDRKRFAERRRMLENKGLIIRAESAKWQPPTKEKPNSTGHPAVYRWPQGVGKSHHQ
jgi:hypothetical protein